MGRGNKVWDVVAKDFGSTDPMYWSVFGKRLIFLSKIGSKDKILDIGMGRGASLFPASEVVGSEGIVIGIDNSSSMVEETKREILERGINNVEVKEMDAEVLRFEKDYFDGVVNGFGMGYILSSDIYMREIRRVVKPGGKVSFSVWGKQDDQKWLTDIVKRYITDKEQKPADLPPFSNAEGVREIFENCEFEDIMVYEEISPVVYNSKEAWMREMNSNAVRNIFEEVKKQGEDVWKAFKADIYEGLDSYKKEDGYVFNMKVIYAFGKNRK